MGFWEVLVPPSLKVQSQDVGVWVEVSVKVTAWAVVGAVGEKVKAATGAVMPAVAVALLAVAVAAFRAGGLKVLIATSLADEGLDVPRASVLILACAGRSAGKVEQRTGRVLRSFAGKDCGIIHDFTDTQHFMLHSQSKARMKLYQRLGYEIASLPSPAFPNGKSVRTTKTS